MGEDKEGEQYTEHEIARRRDEALLRALSTPPKRHSEMKLGKTIVKKKATPDSARKKPDG
jgi:hypothetical protein